MNLFIDTNIFLFFYQYSKDDLEELDKLRVLLRNSEIKLWLPSQVLHELLRNREAKIADALKELKEQRLSFRFPAMSRGYTEHEVLRDLQKEYGKHLARLIEGITKDAAEKKLKADTTIESLIELSEIIKCDDSIYSRAKQRHDCGNPPGKSGSLGDEINWEALLFALPESEPVYIVTDDKDYSSDLDPDKVNPFLLYEWSERKESELFFYRTLSEFFNDKYPNIHFAPDLEKNILIKKFVNSKSFSRTHQAIAKLRRYAYTDFTATQLNEIVNAAVSNHQIYGISDDKDVMEFLSNVIYGQEDKIDPHNLRMLQTLLVTGQFPPPSSESD